MPSRRVIRNRRIATGVVAALVLALCLGVSLFAFSRPGHPVPGAAKRASGLESVYAAGVPKAAPKSDKMRVVDAPEALLDQPSFDRSRFEGKPVSSVDTKKHEVAITFDDGPSPATPQFLALLAKYKAHATFFVIGYRAWHFPDYVYQMVGQGNEVGSHTWNHVRLEKKLGAANLRMQVNRPVSLLTTETGQAPLFVRPRSGKYDAAGLAAVKRAHLVMVLWSSHANDIEDILPPNQLVTNALEGVHPGSIILMHETNPNTLIALPSVLKELKRRGLKPVTLSRLLADAEK